MNTLTTPGRQIKETERDRKYIKRLFVETASPSRALPHWLLFPSFVSCEHGMPNWHTGNDVTWSAQDQTYSQAEKWLGQGWGRTSKTEEHDQELKGDFEFFCFVLPGPILAWLEDGEYSVYTALAADQLIEAQNLHNCIGGCNIFTPLKQQGKRNTHKNNMHPTVHLQMAWLTVAPYCRGG